MSLFSKPKTDYDVYSTKTCRVYKGIRFLPCFWSLERSSVYPKGKNPLKHKRSASESCAVPILEIKDYQVPQKMIVFDLDETLGCFGDLFIMWSGVRHLFPTFNSFAEMFDLYPEFLRYGVLTILEYLYKKKIRGECDKLLIYTNNQCSSEWVKIIADYLQDKVKTAYHSRNIIRSDEPLFDQLICAYRIQSRPNELLRTSHRKSMDDLVKCTYLDGSDLEVCFVDDVEHTRMKESRVYYISPVPYYHSLTAEQIVNRFLESSLAQSYKREKPLLFSKQFWTTWFSSYKRAFEHKRTAKVNVKEYLLVSEQLMRYIQDFIRWKRNGASASVPTTSTAASQRNKTNIRTEKKKRIIINGSSTRKVRESKRNRIRSAKKAKAKAKGVFFADVDNK